MRGNEFLEFVAGLRLQGRAADSVNDTGSIAWRESRSDAGRLRGVPAGGRARRRRDPYE